MKKILLSIMLLLSVGAFSQTTSLCTPSVCIPYNNTDLLQILAQLQMNGTGGGGTSCCTNTTESITSLSLSPAGGATQTISAGFKALSITTSADFIGTINGISRNPSINMSFTSKSNNTLPSIPVLVTSGTVYVDEKK